jgi:hypothetical protein
MELGPTLDPQAEGRPCLLLLYPRTHLQDALSSDERPRLRGIRFAALVLMAVTV